MTTPVYDVAVVGAGWAGLATAVRLVELGLCPILIEAAPQTGGRARGLELTFDKVRLRVDNGQHLLMGAYKETLALIERVATGAPAILRRPMCLRSTDGLKITPFAATPAPLHLIGGLLAAQGLTGSDRLALTIQLLRLRLRGWQTHPKECVADWLQRGNQPRALITRLWEPLCVATLNTPISQACAQTFANVLRDTLGSAAADSDFVLPLNTLDEVLPTPATAWLHQRGIKIQLRTPVRMLERQHDNCWHLQTTQAPDGLTVGAAPIAARQVVLTLPPAQLSKLLYCPAVSNSPQTLNEINQFEFEPIASVYLTWPATPAIDLPDVIMLTETPSNHGYGQWLFDRGEQQGYRLAAVIISARGHDLLGMPNTTSIATAIGRQVAEQLAVPLPLAARVIIDKRATFRCVPERPRLTVDSLAAIGPGLWLAGDHVWPSYPATLEAAVRSGNLAAARCASAAR